MELSFILSQIESQPTIISLLVGAVTAESAVIVALFVYVKSLHKIIQENLKQTNLDNRTIIQESTSALVKVAETMDNHTAASNALATQVRESGKDQVAAAKEYTSMIVSLREWILEQWKSK